jgi:hypothetical protein
MKMNDDLLFRGGTAADVRHVLVGGGRRVVVDGKLTTADSAELRAKINESWRATRARMIEE